MILQWSQMETHLKIGKLILQKYSSFADKNRLDDESEYFPALKIVIEGVVESFDGTTQDKESIKKELVDRAKHLYIDSWLKYAKEDEDAPDIEEETIDAIERFNELYFGKKKRLKSK